MTVYRPPSRDQDPEAIPLTALPVYEERDVTEEHLPTYTEALANPSQTTGDHGRPASPESTMTIATTTTNDVARPTRRRQRLFGPPSPGWTCPAVCGVFYLLVGIGFLVGGIVRSFELSSLNSLFQWNSVCGQFRTCTPADSNFYFPIARTNRLYSLAHHRYGAAISFSSGTDSSTSPALMDCDSNPKKHSERA